MREVISTGDAPGSPLFSQAVRVGDQIFVSGMAGIDVGTGRPPGPTIQEQTRQSLANCRAVLEAAGAGLDDVVEVGILLADPDDFAGMNEEWVRWFPTDPPARYAARLGPVLPGVLISIRMTAVRSSSGSRPQAAGATVEE
ncbi:Rid family hydrolase [Leifsonia sp. fls2-241-R2A-40a]|uniref:RidA family protein n=1 Tax=Leifsonia sp. fls2-241-R2A-40a TaxID=3040290 RepID=UPI00254BF8FC|nr:Rid family hydrolase [Leifsonia sp. fls2-241-R2A-40a]